MFHWSNKTEVLHKPTMFNIDESNIIIFKLQIAI